jgi:hypothetical protein
MWLSGTVILHVTVEIINQVLCGQQTSTSSTHSATLLLSTYPPQQQDTICCKYLSLTLLMMGKILPETC